MNNAKENLSEYVNALTEEQAAQIMNHPNLLQLMSSMTENQLIYTETLLSKLFEG